MDIISPEYPYTRIERFWETPNLFELLKSEIKVWDTLLDLGCSTLADLLDFEFSDFKRLIGIDKHKQSLFWIYRNAETHGKAKEEAYTINNNIERTNQLYDYAFNRFSVSQCRIENYAFADAPYSMIICNKVLHYFPDDQKFQLLERFYDQLQPNGLLYLKLNHTGHPDLQDRSKSDLIDDFSIQPLHFDKFHEKDRVYYIQPPKFAEFISKYDTLLEYPLKEDQTQHLVAVIRKPA